MSKSDSGDRSDAPLWTFWKRLKESPRAFWQSLSRAGKPETDRSRSKFVFGNVFLHLHPARVHRWSLRWWTTAGLGTITLAAFLITVVTGVLLMFYYKPYPAVAYQSVKDIHYVVPTGLFIRNLHRWAAQLMVLAAFLHMARIFFTAAYRKPREFNWFIGLGLLVTTLALSFTGYLLPWDQLAYWAITIGANIAQSPREVTDALHITAYFDPGGFQKELLLGSEEVGEEALIRFYLLHVMVLPIMLGALLAVHFWRIRKDGGLARPVNVDELLPPTDPETYPVFTEEPKKTFSLAALVRGKTPAVNNGPENTVPSLPHLLTAEMAVFMLTIAVCLLLSLISDAPLKEIANPAVPENPAKAPWYFLGLQELVAHSAFMGGIVIPTVVLFGLALIPYLDRETEGTGEWFGGPGGVRLFGWSAVVGLALAIGLEFVTIRYGWFRQWWSTAPQLFITLMNPGTILTALYAAYSIYLVKRYSSLRAGAVGLFTCFLAGFIVLTIVGYYFRGPNWDFYWSPDQWPGH